MGRTRRRAAVTGTIAGLSAILLGGVPATAWLADQHLYTSGWAGWSSQTHGAQVASAPSIKISGTTNRLLRPGGSTRINLRFANPSPHAVTLHHVVVTISKVNAPKADAAHPCTMTDFRVRPMPGLTFVLPGHGFTDLLQLGVPAWQWPHLKLRNRPVNQDGCKGASLSLRYRGYRAW